jgi:HlyD family secretion protein
MKKAIVILILLAAAGGGYYAWTQRAQKSGGAGSHSARQTTAIAELRDISFSVNAAGEITPAEQVSVRPEINGKVEVLPVEMGDNVKKGDLLFKLDDKELQQQRASNLTDIERSRLELQKAERDYKRAEELLTEKLISQELYENTKTTYELAKVGLDRSQKDLAIIEERLTKTEVKAPFECTILTRPISIGQAVSGSGGFNSGTEVLTIADLNSMIINAHVNQADVPRLKVGQTVEVTVEAVTGLKVSGVVERIAPQATIKNNIKGYAARVLLRNVDARVRPGMTANVKIPVASAENVTSVPLAAVFTERDQESSQMERFVYVRKDDGTFEKRNIKVGVSDFFFAEIQEGLAAGEIVTTELPKEEREKKSKQLANQRGSGEEKGPGMTRPGRGAGGTNAPGGREPKGSKGGPRVSGTTSASTNTPAKS